MPAAGRGGAWGAGGRWGGRRLQATFWARKGCGEGWRQRARGCGERGCGVWCDRRPGRDVDDLYCDWADRGEVQESAAVLVRPDKHVGWRSDDLPDDPEEEALMSALRAILPRSA